MDAQSQEADAFLLPRKSLTQLGRATVPSLKAPRFGRERAAFALLGKIVVTHFERERPRADAIAFEQAEQPLFQTVQLRNTLEIRHNVADIGVFDAVRLALAHGRDLARIDAPRDAIVIVARLAEQMHEFHLGTGAQVRSGRDAVGVHLARRSLSHTVKLFYRQSGYKVQSGRGLYDPSGLR